MDCEAMCCEESCFRTGDRMSPRRTGTGSPSHDLMGKDFG